MPPSDHTKSIDVGAALPVDPSRQSRRALRALSDRAQLLRADQRRDPRPAGDPAGAGTRSASSSAAIPNTAYADDARLKIDLVRDHLAGKEMEIGRFYQRRRQWLASVVRFRTVVDEYQTTSHAPEALMRLTESYLALGMPEEAQPLRRRARRQLSANALVRARLRADPGASAFRSARPTAAGSASPLRARISARDSAHAEWRKLTFGYRRGAMPLLAHRPC